MIGFGKIFNVKSEASESFADRMTTIMGTFYILAGVDVAIRSTVLAAFQVLGRGLVA